MEGHIKSTLKNFNPHLPQEMTQCAWDVIWRQENFNPHLPQEMTLHMICIPQQTTVFQSTSPAGDDSLAPVIDVIHSVISIHISRRR